MKHELYNNVQRTMHVDTNSIYGHCDQKQMILTKCLWKKEPCTHCIKFLLNCLTNSCRAQIR